MTSEDNALHKTASIFKDYKPASLSTALIYLAALPLTTLSLLYILAKSFILDPRGFFSSKPRDPDTLALPAALKGLQHRFIEVDTDVKLHAVSFGPQPSRPLLLFLHGFPECWVSWADQLAHYRDTFEVLAVDMRGFNTSSKPQGVSSYTLDVLAADVAAVVRSTGRSSCTLVAHDWGGVVAWAATGRYPGLVDRLIVLAAPSPLMYGRNRTTEQMLRSYYFLWFLLPLLPELLLRQRDADFIRDIFVGGNPYSPRPGAVSAADLEVYKAAVLQPGAATATLNYYRALVLWVAGLMSLSPQMELGLRRQLDMPVLVVWGERDHALCLSNNRDLDNLAPRAQVHVLPGCSHWIQADRPAELRRVLDDWMAANPLTDPAAK